MVAPPLLVWPRAALAVVALACFASAQSGLPFEPVPLDAFRPLSANWRSAAALNGDPRREKTLTTVEGAGIFVCNPGREKTTRGHLFTAWEHGDLELDLEFLLPPGSNSGVYLQGRYEVQLFDSWGVREPTSADCGGIYARYDPARGKDQENYEGVAPRANACRAPGLWQNLHVAFEAPRFDAHGRKVRNARFTRVVLNGFTVHENVEVAGPTRGSAFDDEQPLGPLMIQGDHGPVAIRHLAVKRFDSSAAVAVDGLRYKLYLGDFKRPGEYDAQTPASEGIPEQFSHAAVEKTGKFALVFTGAFQLPRTGAYRFAIQSGGMARLLVDGREAVMPLDRGSQPGIITVAAGRHEFRLDLVHTSSGPPTLELVVEGPNLAPHMLTAAESYAGRGRSGRKGAMAPNFLRVEVRDRVLVQRGFVPFGPRKRLYAASIGTPAGAHYAYDFETAALLRVWRGKFLDTVEMWEGRGNQQTAQPLGPALTFHAKPAVALIEYAAQDDWPDQPDALWSSQGYVLEPDGQPVFLSTLADLAIRDRIAPTPDGRGLTRTLQLKGQLPSWSAWLLLAEAETISRQPGETGWIIGDREWYLDWPAGAPYHPAVRAIGGRQQLAVPLSEATLKQPITYSIIW